MEATRRDLVTLALAAIAAPAAAQTADPELSEATAAMQKSLAVIAKFEVPMSVEPATHFRVY